jgi:hypothetical protein
MHSEQIEIVQNNLNTTAIIMYNGYSEGILSVR